MRETDADFSEYVRAWQLPLTRAAYVVCGDAARAEAAVQRAFVGLALHWDHVRRDDPSAFVRRGLYREALSASGEGRRPRGDGGGVWDLTPRQRAICLLRCLDGRSEADTADILEIDPATARRELHDAVGRLGLSVPAPRPTEQRGAGATRAQIAQLLTYAAEPVREADHAERAWAAAVQRRRHVRRRLMSAAAVVVLVVATAVAVVGSRAEPNPPEARSLTPLPSMVRLWQMSADGIAYVVAPRAGDEATTPQLEVGLPSVIDPAAATRRASEVGFGRPSVFADAVYLQRVSADRWEPVLVWRTGDQLVVDTLQLTDVRTAGGARRPPLGVRAFSNDRTAIAFPQPGRVVVLRTATGTVESIPVPSPSVDRVWWYGGWLMAGAADATWQIGRAPDRQATPVPEAYGLREYRVDGGITVLDDHVPYQPPMLVGWPLTQPYGPTISSADRVASAFHIDGVSGRGITAVRPKSVIVATEGSGRQRMLVLGEERPRVRGCCPVLGWTIDADLVYADTSAGQTWVMAWNVETGKVRRIALWLTSDEVPPVIALGVRFMAG